MDMDSGLCQFAALSQLAALAPGGSSRKRPGSLPKVAPGIRAGSDTIVNNVSVKRTFYLS